MTNENTSQIFKDPVEFSLFIETKARDDKSTCLETLIAFLEDKDIEVDKIRNLLSQSLQDKLRQDFVETGMIGNQNTLDSFFE